MKWKIFSLYKIKPTEDYLQTEFETDEEFNKEVEIGKIIWQDPQYKENYKVKEESTVTNIKLLTEEEVIKEIARISSGDITETAIEHAREMRRAV